MILDQLAIKYGTDKSSLHHNYCRVYEFYFQFYKDKAIQLLEIGTGGYKFANKGGESLRMWCEYFPYGKIISVDLYDKSEIFIPDNGKFFQGSQTDEVFLKSISVQRHDIIIDDGSHINPLTIDTFNIAFPLLKSGGIYVIEDCHTSYWSAVATDGTDFKGGTHEGTVMNYFKRICDEINLNDDLQIRSIHFYKQMIFIFKK